MAKILYTSYFLARDLQRQSELEKCLRKNIANTGIDKIVVLGEGNTDGDLYKWMKAFNKVRVIETPRPTFRDFFDIANILSTKEDISIISNTDIYFDETINKLDNFDMNGVCVALSRYHHYSPTDIRLHNERYSQDSWIFKGKIAPIGFADFYMGIPGCDNRIAYEIYAAGYEIINPAFDIRSIHLHADDKRYYAPGKISKPYLPVPVTSLIKSERPKTNTSIIMW